MSTLTIADHKRETLQVSRESVSFTDMKPGINILGTLQISIGLAYVEATAPSTAASS